MTTIARGVVGRPGYCRCSSQLLTLHQVSFAWTFFAADWVESAGPALPFGIFGMIMGVFALCTIPLWLLGKRMRIATAKFLPKATH